MDARQPLSKGEMLDLIDRSSVVHTQEHTETYTIPEFQKLVLDGKITDRTATAKLVIGGFVNDSYHIYIDRLLVTRSTGVITYRGILRLYRMEDLQIQVTYKAQRFFTREEYKRNNNDKKDKRKRGKRR
ncbi:MAG: hypothetical protein K6G13_11040 [Agathobacter sp.]|uniref:hypothetical protein n=1 Tax=Agathobacter sp. TaxID=2021311 RepID=UPI00258A82B2|nr:hypothetical protein [Agathobacter sp.]MCR5678551.1 hypothetical protein [Agathobacter sp.]